MAGRSGRELRDLRKKKNERTGSTQKSQSSVSQTRNSAGKARAGITREQVQRKVSNAPGYSNGSTLKAYRKKYPSNNSTQPTTANPYATRRNIVNRNNDTTSQNNAHRNRINGSVRRGREQTPINRSQTYATAAEMRKAQEEERNKRASERRAIDAKARSRMSKPVTAMEMRQERTKNLADDKDNKVTETIKTSGQASKKGFLDSVSGHAQTALDALSELTSDEKRNYTWLRAAELSAGIDNKQETRKAAKGTVRTSEDLDKKRRELNAKQELRQAEFDKRTKNASGLQKAIYGAVESGTGMATDIGIGAVTGTGQTGALASMFSRTYGTTRGQAEKEGATEKEDRLYAALQGSKEVATELMFPGWGLAKGYAGKTGLKAGEKLANAVTRNMRGKAADVAYAGLRALGGTVEENLEEVAGWGLDPVIKDLAYGKNVRNRAKAQLLSDMPEITSREEAEALNARLNSGSFVDELAAEYIANGMPEKKARELAEKMRDLYSAYYAGDEKAVEEIGDDVAGEMTGAKKISKESFSTSELLETLASTTLLTGVTGLPGAVTTAQRGSEIKNAIGTEGLKSLAKQVLNSEDAEASERGKVAQAALDAGKDITSTQVFDLEQSLYQQQEKDVKRQQAQLDTAGKQISQNKLVTPFAMDQSGRIVHMEDATIDAYNEAAESAEANIKDIDTKESLTDTDVMYGARAIAGFKTGAFTIDDANAIVSDETVKQAFEEQTGIDLSQYTVRNKNGSINIPKTNAAIKDALFAMAADNLVQMAEVETANWMDTARGETVRQVTARMGAKGSVAVQLALDDMDERDANTYRNMAAASDYIYQSALNIGVPWEDAKDAITSQFSSIPESKLQMLYEAGLADREIANDKMLGLQAKIGEAISLDGERVEDPTMGQCIVETAETPKGSVIRVFSDIADNLGINIHLVDSLPIDEEGTKQANGQYIDGEIYINVNSTFEENLGYIFMHEVTHHLKKYAPEQYKALENLVRDRWFKYSPEQMQSEIAKTIKAYANAGQTLTEEEALEEIIADATHEFLNDTNFAKQVANENPTLAKAVLNAIKEMLHRLRQIFSSGKYENSRTYMNSFFSQIGMLDEAERLWLDAYTEAVKNKAAVGIVEWQDEANKRGERKHSYTTDQEKLIKNGEIPKSLRDWAKEIGLDEISTQPTKGPVEVSVKSLRSAWYQKNGKDEEAKVVNEVLDTIGKSLTNMIGKYNYIDLGDAVNASVHYRTDKDGKPVSVILTCQVKNAEYEVNFDFTTICSKRLAMQRVLERFIKTEGESKGTLYDELKLDEEGMYKLRLILEKAGFEVSCKGCFVEQNRYSQQGQAKTIADDWNKAIDEWEKENNTKVTENFDLVNMDINALDYDEIQEAFDRYGELIKGRPTNVESKNRTLIEAHPFFRKRMNPSDYASMAGQRALMAIGAKGGRTLYGLLKRGQSDSKQSVPFTAYNGEIALLPDKMKGQDLFDYLMSIGGARAQSASDFQIEYFYDYMQLVADLSARGLPMHMYTKVIELAELFGMTGVKINLSAMCDVDESLGGEYAGLKLVDGKYEYNISDQSIDYEKAVELQKKPGYSKNIGIIMVTLSKQHMLKSLDDDDVRYIIGYHSSSMPAVVAQMTNMGNATDYTKLNKTNKLNDEGKALFAKAMEEAEKQEEGKTKLDIYKDALRIFDDMIQEEVANDKRKVPRRGNEYARYMSGYGNNTAEFNTYDDLKKSNDARKTADNYIEWCMKNDLIPIYFPFAFHDNYYKCEIYDFNMYDNTDGSYAPMEAVQNIYPGMDMTNGETDTTAFMDKVTKMMDERNAVNRDLDSMYDTVFDEAKEELKFSITGDEYFDFDAADMDRTELTPRADAPKTEEQMRDDAYMSAVNSGNMEEAQRLVDEAAKKAGYTTRTYHGTGSNFTVFDPERSGKNYNGFSKYGQGLYFTDSEDRANEWGKGRNLLSVYLKADNFFDETISTSNETLMKEYNRLRRENDPALVREFERRGVPFDRTEEITGIVFEEINRDSGDKGFTTQLLKGMGYDGVKAEHEGFTGSPAWTEYVVFDPEQIKSADTVTYAEDGSVIPLSERFDPNNDDIRYSLPTQDSDGKVLTDGQMEYFKNSQARDAEGKLAVVYHTTNKGGFTIFDPSYSDDKRSLFFASNWDVSQTYGRQAENPIDLNAKPYTSYADFLKEAEQRFNKDTVGDWDETKSVEENLEVNFTKGWGPADITIDEWKDADKESDYEIELIIPKEDGSWQAIQCFSYDQLLRDLSFEMGKKKGQNGYYSCYLNLENPMIVDAKGHNWNDIPYGPEGNSLEEHLEELEESSNLLIESVYAIQNADDDGWIRKMDIQIIYRTKDKNGKWSMDQYFEDHVDLSDVHFEDEGELSVTLWEKTNDVLENFGLPAEYIDDLELNHTDYDGDIYWGKNERGEDVPYDYINTEEDSYEIVDIYDYDMESTYRTRELAEMAEDFDHDGVIIRNCRDIGGASHLKGNPISDIYIAFSSNQVKDVGNENPTENPDIRYSVTPEDEAMEWLASQWDVDDVPLEDKVAEEGRVRMAKSKEEFINTVNTKWNERWLTEGKVIDVKYLKKNIKSLVKSVMSNSDTSRQYKTELVDKLVIACKSAYWLSKDGKDMQASAVIWYAAEDMVKNIDLVEDTMFTMYKDLREYMRNTAFKLGEEYWSDVDYNSFRRKNFGRIKLVKGETNIDELYQELQERWPEWFDEEEEMNPADQLLRIDYVLDTIQPYRVAYSSEEASELILDISQEIWNIIREGEEYKSLADTLNEKYDAKTKALKERHEEALRKVKENSEKKLDKEKAKFKEYKAKEKNAKEKAKHFGHIQDNIDWLTERLVKETKDKNIPEGFRRSLAHMLLHFDMQTERSKALEEKYGPAKKTLKIRELYRRLEDISKEDESGEFAYNGYLFYMMDALADKVDGKTIDALDVEDLIAIDTMLKAIKHNFQNYNKVWKEGKQEEIASFGDKTIEVMDERISKYGKRKTYAGSRGIVDKLLNEGEETPIYFFGRLDPNNEGIGAMYQELSRGEDRHIRNMNFLRNRFQAICGDYFNEKKPGSELEAWRDDSQAQTFNLKNGPITLNPAQIMSLYCLSKRDQAMGHILGAGIVASPVTFGAKLKDAFKGKDEQVSSVMITYDEIQTIIATLTKDQIKIAEELQSLMNNEMAAWGNETSLKMHGIKLFREHDYFPIQSSNEVLSKNADNVEVTEKIKNFGFTKPLTRNANNAIMIDDIFSVTADHCNKMSLYNAFAIPISDFMRVYNYKQQDEDGSVKTVQQAIGEAFTRKADSYIMKLIGDINGNTKTRSDAVDDLMNKTLANYKKASIGANVRVALQQICSIFRSWMVINPKYFNALPSVTPATMREMFEHCPKALWKSWGHYDVDMGRDIEDIMMNNDWSRWDTLTMGAYGMLDNVAWTTIWQATKNEIKATRKDLTVGSDEFWEACNIRAKEIFDRTQVVDSIFNRSDVMRSKNTLTKLVTSFMAEPTLTYNMLRHGVVEAYESFKDGDPSKAMGLLLRTGFVFAVNVAAVSAASAVWDAVRGKGADGDDDKDWGELWWLNFIENVKDNGNIINQMYFFKDIYSLKDGWGTSNMALEGWETLFKGLDQIKKKIEKGDDYVNKKTGKPYTWYEIMMNFLGGVGYVTGHPFKTIMRDAKAIGDKFGIEVFAADGSEEDKDVAEGIMNKLGYRKKDGNHTLPGVKDGTKLDNTLNMMGINLTPAEKEQKQMKRKTEELAKKHNDLSGDEKDKALWSDVSKYMKESGEEKSFSDLIAEGNYTEIRKYRRIYEEAGGDLEYFDGRMFDESKKALKKSIAFNTTDQQYDAQQRMLHYLETHGMSQEEISSEIVYKSDVARDMKVAMRIGDMALMEEAAKPLAEAGLTYTDLERLWKNRNRGVDLEKYKKNKGRYADKLKSMGTFVWPTQGTVTSHFGYRNAPTAGASSNHPAIDIGASTGTPVVAADGGVVIYANSNGGYGNSVGIKHDNGMVTYYNHLYSYNVKEGDTVSQGQQIAQVGSTGISTGPHLDFKILDANGKPVDPEKYLS